MKTSRRLLLGTFVTLLAAPVVLVAYSRIVNGTVTPEAPVRTSPAELAALRDFTQIDIRSDTSVEIVNGTDYAISYSPLIENRGFFTARVADGTLFIEGYGNRLDDGTGSRASAVRITLPELERIDAESVTALTVRNFDSDALSIRVGTIFGGPIALENNRLGNLQLQLGPVQNVVMRGNSIGTSTISHFGLDITTE